jgi:hypothetical protein
MAISDRSIFRQRAIDKYMQRGEGNALLRLVSPRLFFSLWLLLLLAVGAGVLVWSVQEPIMLSGKGLVVQPKATAGQPTPGIVVLLLFSPAQEAKLKIKQPVIISIQNANITFNSSIQTIETGVMSPSEISTQLNAQLSLAQTISGSGPSVVAIAPVEPMSVAKTYLGSMADVQVQIGSQSALSLLPGYSNITQFLSATPGFIRNIPSFVKAIPEDFRNIGHDLQIDWQGLKQLLLHR